MHSVDIIRKKRDGQALTRAEIEAFIRGVTARSWPDYQTTALLMAIFLRDMNDEETAWLTEAMVHSGKKLDLSDIPGVKADKHSTGGVGDKVSLILAPLAAACGLVVPMMSGRGLGHSGGTLDKLASIPGFRTDLSEDELRQMLRRSGCALMGQTEQIAPADRILYALRDVTATVENVPLITASILSKKIAEGIEVLLLDVKCGRGAFMKTRDQAERLARSLVRTGQLNGVRTAACLTAMDAPLGYAVGNSLEVIEALETLKGAGPEDLTSLCLTLTSRMLQLAQPELSAQQAEDKVRAALGSGQALGKFCQIIVDQGGDPRVVDDYNQLPLAPQQRLFRSRLSGYVSVLDAELIGRAAMLLGGGRQKVDDVIDPAVGIVLHIKPGQYIRGSEIIAEVHYRDESKLGPALRLLDDAVMVSQTPVAPGPLLLGTVE